jgi:hypothetical protein
MLSSVKNKPHFIKLVLSAEFLFDRPFLKEARWQMFAGASFLVSIPVFFQAPLVGVAPGVSLLMTVGWLLLSFWLWQKPKYQLAGDLLFGFTLSWWAGGLYWGWLRTQPMLHLAIEAIPLPIAVGALCFGYFRIGSLFFLGSLLGTCLTDFYCMGTGLMPWWERMMSAEDSGVSMSQVLPGALAQMHTLTGGLLAMGTCLLLLGITVWATRTKELHMWAFAGAVFSTLFVDGLFWALSNAFLVGS